MEIQKKRNNNIANQKKKKRETKTKQKRGVAGEEEPGAGGRHAFSVEGNKYKKKKKTGKTCPLVLLTV